MRERGFENRGPNLSASGQTGRQAMERRPASTTRRRRSAKQKAPLVITSNLVVPPTIMGWERELLLPVVGKIVADLVKAANEADAKETGTPSP